LPYQPLNVIKDSGNKSHEQKKLYLKAESENLMDIVQGLSRSVNKIVQADPLRKETSIKKFDIFNTEEARKKMRETI
jgi:hypothetical protein